MSDINDLLAVLDRVRANEPPELGIPGARPENVADDRSGRYWRVPDAKVIDAIKVALVTGRALLIEGPSGTGKSSIARAIANTLAFNYCEKAITSQTTAKDLLYEVDFVRRLHDAQRLAHPGAQAEEAPGQPSPAAPNFGGISDYVRPGHLWWAFNPTTAASLPLGTANDPRQGPLVQDGHTGDTSREEVRDDARTVVLLDEIDKADPDVPNNLLVPIGSGRFDVEDLEEPVEVADPTRRPLVIITTNRERDLPPAFLRRCVRIELSYAQPDQLIEIARKHIPADGDEQADEWINRLLSLLLPGTSPDGQAKINDRLSTAEFVDGVRALTTIRPAPDDDIWNHLAAILTGNSPGT